MIPHFLYQNKKEEDAHPPPPSPVYVFPPRMRLSLPKGTELVPLFLKPTSDGNLFCHGIHNHDKQPIVHIHAGVAETRHKVFVQTRLPALENQAHT